MKKKRLIGSACLLLMGLYPCLFCAYHLHYVLLGQRKLVFNPVELIAGAAAEKKILSFFGLLLLLLLVFCVFLLFHFGISSSAGMQTILPGIRTPLPCGDNLHGSARWLTPKEYREAFHSIPVQKRNPVIRWLTRTGYDDLTKGFKEKQIEPYEKPLFPAGGIVVGQSKNGKTVYLVEEDTHSLTFGATRSGKSRSVVLPSICMTALAGESMVMTDMKRELYLSTAPFLLRLGYEVIALDFDCPAKSDQYNFMQLVNDRLESGDITGAKSATNELVESLTGKSKQSERIWEEGEKSILACCIMAVAYDNRNNPQMQNLTNVYHFIANMCAPQEGQSSIPLQEYLENCPENHPAKSLAGISNVAHFRTRSSFYAAALATLRLFEDYNIADMTSRTSFSLYTTGQKKRAVFIILPDEKPAYYSVASLFVFQHYQALVATAKANGGRLPLRVEFFLDEVGNFSEIPYFEKLMTVGAGRGLRFHLFLQSSLQLDEIYNKNRSSIIRSNCETWVYLHSDDPGTDEEISKHLGNYTTKSPSLSAPIQGISGGNASFNYMGRPLLTPEEVRKVKRPFQLVLSRHDPAVLYAPDLSKTVFNRMLGLGDEEHNSQVNKLRHERRKERLVRPPQLWKIWEAYQNKDL